MKLNYKRTFMVGFAFFAITAFWQLYDHTIPLILKYSFGMKDSTSGIVMAADNVLALMLLPLFGMLSDRTNSKWGRRMPYIMVGSIGAAASMLLIPYADKMKSLPLFVVALFITLLFMGSYRSPAVALMPDVTIPPLRSKGNAIINLMGAVGGVAILVTIGKTLPKLTKGQTVYRPDYFTIYLICAIMIIVATVILAIFVKEKKLVADMHKEMQIFKLEEPVSPKKEPISKPMPAPVRRSFVFLVISLVMWFMGYNAVTTAFSKYCVEEFQLGAGESAQILLIASVAAILSYWPVGMIASKIGRKKTIIMGIIMLGTAFGVAATITQIGFLMYAVFALAGVGWASINVNSYPMMVELATGSNVGTFTGFYYFASMGAQTITPYISGKLMENYGYRLLFPYGTFFLVLALFSFILVKHGDSKPTPAKSKLEAFDVADD